jgi:O-methyltransferase
MWKLFSAFLAKRGIYFFKPQHFNGKPEFEINNFSYGINMPTANYAPWKNDTAFADIYSAIKENTLVDIYRCYDLWLLIGEILKQSKDLNILEIGVWRGGTASVMLKKMQQLGATGTVYLADTFTGVVKTGAQDTFYTGGEHKDTSIDIVKNLLQSKQLSNFKLLQGIFPDDTASLIPVNTKFGLCHIDVDVYLSAKGCLEWVWDKLVPGGIVVFDDYGFHTCDGVTRLVNEQREKNDRVVIYNLNGHGVIIKIK